MSSNNRYYSASLVAKYTGYNKYVDSKKEILGLIKPNPNKDLNLIQAKLALLLSTPDQLNDTELNLKDLSIPTNIESLEKFNNSDNISHLSGIIGADQNDIQSSLNCFYGSSNEINVIDLIKEKYGYDVVENNNKCYSMFLDGNSGSKICGRIDGYIHINGEKYLVEIKSRKNRLFTMMPIYEKVQILLYTKLCDCNKVIYVQNYGTQLSLEIFDNFNDDKLYNEVIKRLKLVDQFVNIGNNTDEYKIDELCYWC